MPDKIVTQQVDDKLSIPDFAKIIKDKYPQYNDINDTTLVNKIIEKYPQYKEKINIQQSNSIPTLSPEQLAQKTPDQQPMPELGDKKEKEEDLPWYDELWQSAKSGTERFGSNIVGGMSALVDDYGKAIGDENIPAGSVSQTFANIPSVGQQTVSGKELSEGAKQVEKKTEDFNKTLHQPKGFWGAVGSTVPYIGAGVASMLFPPIAPLVTTGFGMSGVGEANEAVNNFFAPKYAKEKVDNLIKEGKLNPNDKQAVNAAYQQGLESFNPDDVPTATRMAAQVGYSAAYSLPIGGYLAKFVPESMRKYVTDAAMNLLSRNPEFVEGTGKAILDKFINSVDKNTAAKVLKPIAEHAVSGAATMESIAGMKLLTDKYAIGRNVTWDEVKKTGVESLLNGVLFGVAMAPFAKYAQNKAREQRWKQTGYITVTLDKNGNSIEVLPGQAKGGDAQMGLTASGDPVKLSEEEMQRAFTVPYDVYQKAKEQYKQTGSVPNDIERQAFEGRVKDVAKKLSDKNGRIFVAKHRSGESAYIRKDNGNSYDVITPDGQLKTDIPKDEFSQPQVVNINDFYESMMNAYDKSHQPNTVNVPGLIGNHVEKEAWDNVNAIKHEDKDEIIGILDKQKNIYYVKKGDISIDDKGNVSSPTSTIVVVDADGNKKMINVDDIEGVEVKKPEEAYQDIINDYKQTKQQQQTVLKKQDFIAENAQFTNKDGKTVTIKPAGGDNYFLMINGKPEGEPLTSDQLIEYINTNKAEQTPENAPNEPEQANNEQPQQKTTQEQPQQAEIPKTKEGETDYDKLIQENPELFKQEFSKEFGEEDANKELVRLGNALQKENDKLIKKLEATTSINESATLKRKIKENENKIQSIKQLTGTGEKPEPVSESTQGGEETKPGDVQSEPPVESSDNTVQELSTQQPEKQKETQQDVKNTLNSEDVKTNQNETPNQSTSTPEAKETVKADEGNGERPVTGVKGENGKKGADEKNKAEADKKIKKIIKKQSAKPRKRKPGLYDKALQTDVTGNPRGLALQYFVGGGKVSPEGIKELFGNDKTERNKRISIVAKKENGGNTPEMIAHAIWTDHPEVDVTDLRDAVEDVLMSYNSKAQMAHELLDKFPKETSGSNVNDLSDAFKEVSNGEADDYDSYVRFLKEVAGMPEQDAIDAADMVVDPVGTLKRINERNKNEIEQYNEIIKNELSKLDKEGSLPSEEEIFNLFNHGQENTNPDNRSSEKRDLPDTESNPETGTQTNDGNSEKTPKNNIPDTGEKIDKQPPNISFAKKEPELPVVQDKYKDQIRVNGEWYHESLFKHPNSLKVGDVVPELMKTGFINDKGDVFINPTYVTDAQWKKLTSKLTDIGFEKRPWQDWRDYFTKKGPQQVTHDEHKQAIEEAILNSKLPVKEKTKDYNKLISDLKKEYGTTKDYNEAGYLLTDGSMLDFSGKNEGGMPGQRVYDHRQLPDDTNMVDFMAHGNIRLKPESHGFELTQMPTDGQIKELKRYIDYINNLNDNHYGVIVDVSRPGSYGRVFSIEYDKGTPANRIINDLINYFENGVRPVNRFSRLSFSYYSPTEHAIEFIKQDKGTPDQMKSQLLKNGAKQAELDWMGWDDFVKGKDKLTKKEIEDWVKENKVRLDEVVRGENESLEPKVKRLDNGKYAIVDNFGEIWDIYNTYEDAKDDLEHYQDNLPEITNRTKYSQPQYKLPGGENYREFILTMPGQIEPYRPDDIHFTDEGGGTAVVWTRTQDFKDETGDDVLHLEEIQSKRGQEGKRRGFGYKEHEHKVYELANAVYVAKKLGRQNVLDGLKERAKNEGITEQEIQDALNKYGDFTTVPSFRGVPDMPFRKTQQWAGLALKRMVQEAAENGYDAVTWTTGETQAERYDLSKHISQISHIKNPDGTYDLVTVTKDGRVEEVKHKTEEELENLVGKDVTEKIVKGEGEQSPASKMKVLKGLDLKVDGEGMKGFYDNILPKLANKLFKKYGATVTKTKLDNGVEVWKLHLTPELKKVASGGFPMFKLKTKPELPKTAAEYLSDEYQQKVKEYHDELRKQARGIAKNIGVDVNIVESENQLPKYYRDYIKSVGASGMVKGFYAEFSDTKPGEGEIYLILNAIDNTKQLRETLLHEAAAHKGLQKLFGSKYNKLLDDIYRSMKPEDIEFTKKLYSWTDEDGNVHEPSERQIAHEFLGKKAQDYEKPGFIKRVLAKVRDWIRQLFGLKYSDNDIANLFRRSIKNMKREQMKAEKAKQAEFAGEMFKDKPTVSMFHAWHGSPHDFDQFSKEHIGEGEGAQAFGYGLYFTDKEGIAKAYAERGNYYDYITVNGIPVNKTPGRLWQGLRFPEYSDKKSLKESLERDFEYYNKLQKSDLKLINNKKVKENNDYYNSIVKNINERKKEIEAIKYLLDNFNKIELPNRNLYKVKIHGDKNVDELNFLRWDKPISEEQINLIKKQAKKENIQDIWGRSVNDKGYYPNSIPFSQGMTGEQAYNQLMKEFGMSDKAASDFLLRAGIDGIKYPSEFTSKGSHEDSFNYVVFDDKPIEIEDKISFSLKGEKSAKENDFKKYNTIEKVADFLTRNNNAFSNKLTKWGSEYVKVNGITFRKSDHKAKYPVDYEIKDYSEIPEILNKIGKLNITPISREDFIKLYNDGGKYKDYSITKIKDSDGSIVYDNGFGKFVDKESAANNLYSRLFNMKPKMSFSINEKDQTQTPEFKKWFRDSKVVDKDGKPLVVYHGTKDNFNVFDENELGKNTNHPSSKWGFAFTPDKEYAKGYSYYGKDNSIVKDVYLSISNPKIIDFDEYNDIIKSNKSDEFISKVKGDGYDGVIIKVPKLPKDSPFKERYSSGIYEVFAFSPTQIKSATGNRGTFDENNPNISFSKSPKEKSIELANSKQPTSEELFRKGLDGILDDWFKKIDWTEEEAKIDAAQAQAEIKAMFKRNPVPGLKNWKEADEVMHYWMDHLGQEDVLEKNLNDKSEDNKMTPEQKRLLKASQNLPDEYKKFAFNRFLKEYNIAGNEALDNGVIFNLIDNYVRRSWKLPGKRTNKDYWAMFSTHTSHAKQRTLPTISDGFYKGLDLATKGASNNLAMLKTEIRKVIENRRLIERARQIKDADGNPLLSTKKRNGYELIKHPSFKIWVPEGKIKTNGDELQRVDYETFVTKDGTVFKLKDVYAPKPIADRINNILSTNTLKDYPGLREAMMANDALKKLVLSGSFFHHAAFTAGYLLGSPAWVKDINPVKAYKTGLEMAKNKEPLFKLLVENGMTTGLEQDWDEKLLDQKTQIGKLLDKYNVPSDIRDKVYGLYKAHTDFLFKKYGAGLKIINGVTELQKHIQRNPKANVNVLAKEVADMMNDNYGGLHLKRMERNQNIQSVMRLLLLAPDWTESNLRMVLKAFGWDYSRPKGERRIPTRERRLYQRFWLRVLSKAVLLSIAANAATTLLESKQDKKDFWDTWIKRYKYALQDPERLNWIAVDVTPIYRSINQDADTNVRKYESILRQFQDPWKWAVEFATGSPATPIKHKGSILARMVSDFATGSNWQGKRYTSLAELFGKDDKGTYSNSKLNPDWKPGDDPSKKWKYQVLEPRGGKLKGKLTKWGKPYDNGGVKIFAPDPEKNDGLSWALSELRASTPIPLQNTLSYLTGEMDGYSALMHGIGFHGSTAYVRHEDAIKEFKTIEKESEKYIRAVKHYTKEGDLDKVSELMNSPQYMASMLIVKRKGVIDDYIDMMNTAINNDNFKEADEYKKMIDAKINELRREYYKMNNETINK